MQSISLYRYGTDIDMVIIYLCIYNVYYTHIHTYSKIVGKEEIEMVSKVDHLVLFKYLSENISLLSSSM